MKILAPDVSYSFSKIFELKILTDELTDELDYTLSKKKLELPQHPDELDRP
jgi:hypothetical protein